VGRERRLDEHVVENGLDRLRVGPVVREVLDGLFDAVVERPVLTPLANLADALALLREVDEFEVRRERARDDVPFLRVEFRYRLPDGVAGLGVPSPVRDGISPQLFNSLERTRRRLGFEYLTQEFAEFSDVLVNLWRAKSYRTLQRRVLKHQRNPHTAGGAICLRFTGAYGTQDCQFRITERVHSVC